MYFILIDKLHIRDFLINIDEKYDNIIYYYSLVDIGFGLHKYKIFNCNYELSKKLLNFKRYDVINLF